MPRNEYPKFYSIAEEAADKLGCEKKITIAASPDNNIGVNGTGKEVVIILGAVLLFEYSEKELYAVLLHEFSHLSDKKRLRVIKNLSNVEAVNTFALPLLHYAFLYLDWRRYYRYAVYEYACSVAEESRADGAIAEYCDKETASSVFLKLFYQQMYGWERGSYDETPYLSMGDEGLKNRTAKEAKAFGERCEQRKNEWKKYFFKEILARNASHPTFAMRLEALGVTELTELPYGGSEEYVKE
ncbi:MAG: M48 family metalloprotease, partial [Clostridia bacterium]|nr:M48 family metalloprotease [Clostridia bacterium]